jgi:hypothetical protein
MRTERKAPVVETLFIGVSAAAVIAVVLANVIRVHVSPEVAVFARTVLFAASWLGAIVWAILAGRHAVLTWLGVLAGCASLIAVCEFQRDLDMDTGWHVDEGTSGPHGGVECRELVVP